METRLERRVDGDSCVERIIRRRIHVGFPRFEKIFDFLHLILAHESVQQFQLIPETSVAKEWILRWRKQFKLFCIPEHLKFFNRPVVGISTEKHHRRIFGSNRGRQCAVIIVSSNNHQQAFEWLSERHLLFDGIRVFIVAVNVKKFEFGRSGSKFFLRTDTIGASNNQLRFVSSWLQLLLLWLNRESIPRYLRGRDWDRRVPSAMLLISSFLQTYCEILTWTDPISQQHRWARQPGSGEHRSGNLKTIFAIREEKIS